MLEFRNVKAAAGGKEILHGIDLKLVPHTLTAVIGKNGSGKSTLLSCIHQTQKHTGEILFGERALSLMPPKERACLVSVLPQALRAPHITVESLAEMGRTPYLDLAHRLSDADRKAINSALEAVGIEQLAACFLDEISGGERQKAYLAMMLSQDARVMVFDEPTTYMDISQEHAFLRQLQMLRIQRKKTVLAVMHDLSAAVKYADRIVVMDEGRIRFSGSREECLQAAVIEEVFAVQRCSCGDQIFFTAKSDKQE